jgi:hypothetical protein
MARSIEVPFWENEDGTRTLQCHSRGYKEKIGDREVPLFSPFGVRLQYGTHPPTTLENLFMCCRVFDIDGNRRRPSDWREARAWMKIHPQIGWDLETGFIPILSPPAKVDGWKVDEAGIKFYVALYAGFLDTPEGQRRLAIAHQFDEFFDPFKGGFPFGQEEVFRTAVRHGVEYLDLVADDIWDRMLNVTYLDRVPQKTRTY